MGKDTKGKAAFDLKNEGETSAAQAPRAPENQLSTSLQHFPSGIGGNVPATTYRCRPLDWGIPEAYSECKTRGGNTEVDLGHTLIIRDLGQDRYEATTLWKILENTCAKAHQYYQNTESARSSSSKHHGKTSGVLSPLQIMFLCENFLSFLSDVCRHLETLNQIIFHEQLGGLSIQVKGIATWRSIELSEIRSLTSSNIYAMVFVAMLHVTIAMLSPAVNGVVSVMDVFPFEGFVFTYDAPKSSPIPKATVSMSISGKTSKLDKYGDEPYCWLSLFEGANVYSIPSIQRGIDASIPQGLQMDFAILTALATVRTEVLHDGGIILLGFDTALIPLEGIAGQKKGIMRWHFACTPGKQITRDIADAFGNRRLALKSISDIPSIAVIGWSSDAIMLMGSDALSASANRSQFHAVKSHRATTGYSKEFNLAVNPPFFSLGGKLGKSNAYLPTRCAFDPQRSHVGILNQATNNPFIVFDDASEEGWLVPGVNLLLNCVQLYLQINKYVGALFYSPETSPAAGGSSNPTAQPPSNGISGSLNQITQGIRRLGTAKTAQAALSEDQSFHKADGQLGMSTKALVSLLWMRIADGEKLSRDPSTQEFLSNKSTLKGVELYDISTDGELILKEAPVTGSMKAWYHLATLFPVVFCSGIGQLIQPKAPLEREVCSGGLDQYYPKGLLTCRPADLLEAVKGPARWFCTREPYEFSGLQWQLKLNSFDPCLHSSHGEKRKTCWSKDRFQEITKPAPLKTFNFANKPRRPKTQSSGKETASGAIVFEVPESSAVRFGVAYLRSSSGGHRPQRSR